MTNVCRFRASFAQRKTTKLYYLFGGLNYWQSVTSRGTGSHKACSGTVFVFLFVKDSKMMEKAFPSMTRNTAFRDNYSDKFHYIIFPEEIMISQIS
jgi:hypothetical protein